MARPQDGHLWALAHAERAALAEDLAGLGPEQWRHDTLCGEWDVEQVVHLTAAASLNQWQWLRSMLTARFRPDVHNQRRLAEHCGSTELDLRASMARSQFPYLIRAGSSARARRAGRVGSLGPHGRPESDRARRRSAPSP